ncbi:LytR/AlgR family response regulator transcription factor [Jiulongibacter sediminis]|uniref:HTH LytTR-type domain-containing protein n=1 Tax=Jiulongibacter sediminis TaxID=1605367 RepID=A0A0P7BT49_9BACT|nr:LytTR family DNA-binding domain-containing protein [Jiulongibacter sediminis]KPM47679.1 hypothetical protein AFM12_14510 [Jiulongibacter sediminis]TBX23472.1 hypothetical protein TK44_14520 [Jiulongibacter sediminis]
MKKIRIGGHLFAQPKKLLRLEADVNYTHIYYKDGRYVYVATTLGKLESRLKEHGFYRVDRGTVVNVDSIKSYRKVGSCLKAKLSNDLEVNVSKRRVKAFLELSSALAS